jgi:hypothetical protein
MTALPQPNKVMRLYRAIYHRTVELVKNQV